MIKFREPINGFTHLAGAVSAAMGLFWLISQTQDTPHLMLSVLVYGFSTIITLSASAVLHLYDGSKHELLWLARIDHASIYLMIAGSYTPVLFAYLTGTWRWGLLLVIWAMAAAGIAYKLFVWHRDSFASTAYYLLMGWVAVLAIPQAIAVAPMGFVLLVVAEGIIFTLGALIFAFEWPNLNAYWGFHEIWHLFVLAGAALHFAAIAVYIV